MAYIKETYDLDDAIRDRNVSRDEVIRLRARVDQLIYVLGLARGKLAAYRAAHSGEYVGGMEFSALDRLIEETVAHK